MYVALVVFEKCDVSATTGESSEDGFSLLRMPLHVCVAIRKRQCLDGWGALRWDS